MDEAWKAAILADFPELPLSRRARFVTEYGLPEYDADILTVDAWKFGLGANNKINR